MILEEARRKFYQKAACRERVQAMLAQKEKQALRFAQDDKFASVRMTN
jgi:hypothetical protein